VGREEGGVERTAGEGKRLFRRFASLLCSAAASLFVLRAVEILAGLFVLLAIGFLAALFVFLAVGFLAKCSFIGGSKSIRRFRSRVQWNFKHGGCHAVALHLRPEIQTGRPTVQRASMGGRTLVTLTLTILPTFITPTNSYVMGACAWMCCPCFREAHRNGDGQSRFCWSIGEGGGCVSVCVDGTQLM
jgi:UPF0716 family protein affecting phage T7 exclusion